MPTRTEITQYQSTIDGLSTVAAAQVKALLQSLDQQNPIAFRDALLRTYPEILSPFMTASSEVAATWYAQLRAEAGITSTFTPTLAQEPAIEQINARVRYSLSPLFQPTEFLGSDILTQLAGATQKFIADQARDTISSNTQRDPVRVGYQRVPRAGCCAFCGLMASRGAVYRTSEAAGGVIGRGVDASVTKGKVGGQGRGVKARGSQNIGDRFHAYCRCVVVPRFEGGDNEYLVYAQKEFLTQYQQGAGEVLSDYSKRNPEGTQFGSRDLKATLANWRKENNVK